MAPDKNDKEKKPPTTPVAALALPDGTLVETIYQRDRGRTGFVVGQGEAWTYESNLEVESGETLVPLSPGNNLLKHRIVLLPERPSEYGDTAALIEEIAAYIHRYVDFEPTFERLAAHYVLFTWVYDAFNEVPYLRFRGDYGSGKTRALLTVGSLCYKAFFASGASTVSPIFHILDGFRGTLVLDEADFRFSDEKAELVKILNNGNVRGLPVLRTMPSPNGKEFNPRAFNVFGPKIVASRGSFEDRALESRFLTEEMGQRGVRSDIPINLPNAQKEEAGALQNKLLLYRLRNRHRVGVGEHLSDPSLEPRFNQILAPLLAVIDDSSLRREVQLHVRGNQDALISERGQSIEGQVLALLSDFLAETPDRAPAIGSVVSRYIEKHGGEVDRAMTAKWMGSILRKKLGLPTYRQAGLFYVSLRDAERLRVLFRRYGLTEDAATLAGH
jgi:hypothetical protein